MERTGIHELTAAYALDALDAEEREDFEAHLAHCAQCQETVAAFHDTAASLALASRRSSRRPAFVTESSTRRAANARTSSLLPRRAGPSRATGAVAALAAILAIVLSAISRPRSAPATARREAAGLRAERGRRPASWSPRAGMRPCSWTASSPLRRARPTRRG